MHECWRLMSDIYCFIVCEGHLKIVCESVGLLIFDDDIYKLMKEICAGSLYSGTTTGGCVWTKKSSGNLLSLFVWLSLGLLLLANFFIFYLKWLKTSFAIKTDSKKFTDYLLRKTGSKWLPLVSYARRSHWRTDCSEYWTRWKFYSGTFILFSRGEI